MGKDKSAIDDAKMQAMCEVSRSIFNGLAELRVVSPFSLLLLKKNARYFKKDRFQQLVSNVREDKLLSSVPLCIETEKGKLEVVSGNHRVKASREAGLGQIIVMVMLGDYTKSQKVAIQLSHNALVGEDDKALLADLWSEIENVNDQLYVGLSADDVAELENIKPVTFQTPQMKTKAVTFVFTESEVEVLDDVLSELEMMASSDKVYVDEMKRFDAFFGMIRQAKTDMDIKNQSLAMIKLLELLTPAMEAYRQEKESEEEVVE